MINLEEFRAEVYRRAVMPMPPNLNIKLIIQSAILEKSGAPLCDQPHPVLTGALPAD